MRAVAAAAALAFAGLASAANITEWKTRSIYQIMIDRYARTDGSTDHECEAYTFCGGTWAGLTNHLDYIQGKTPSSVTLLQDHQHVLQAWASRPSRSAPR